MKSVIQISRADVLKVAKPIQLDEVAIRTLLQKYSNKKTERILVPEFALDGGLSRIWDNGKNINSANLKMGDVFSGLKMSNDLSPVLAEMFYSTHSLIANSVDIKIKPYKKYYHYISTTGRYEMSFPLNFTSEKGFFGVGTDIISKVTLDEKTLFVRYFILRNEITLKTYEQLGLEPEYVIENWDGN